MQNIQSTTKQHFSSVLVLCSVLLAGQCQAQSERVPQWPLRNGDFSIIGGRAGDNPMAQMYWQHDSREGEHRFTVDPPAAAIPIYDADLPPATAILTTTKPGPGRWYQTFPLEKGEYRLSVEVSGSAGAIADIAFVSKEASVHKAVKVADTPRTLEIALKAPGGEASVSLGSSVVGTVKFAKVKIEAAKLISAVIPTTNAIPIGGIVLSAKPSPAERWACYQLQHFVNRITGLTPGLKGRDPIYPGRLVYIGRAANTQLKSLKGLPVDSYLTGSTGKEIVLAGNSDEATLYAVFDFLKQQGCRWITPGALGEVIPKKSKLTYAPLRKEIPDFDVRGGLVTYSNFSLAGEQFFVSFDDHLDWAVRNRENAVWMGYDKTSDLGAHRGHGWIQNTSHSYQLMIAPGKLFFKEHPDWYPLVNGVRVARDASGRETQLCVSNQGLRDYTVDLALHYFKENPHSKIFAMNPNDGATFWCECDQCKALDPPGIDWSRNGIDQLFMSDRALDFANYVAKKIAKVNPEYKVELYAYGCTREAPVKTRVDKNVIIHYAYWGGPLNKPFMYDAEPNRFQEYRLHLDGWKKAGAIQLIHYNYLDWYHPDAPTFWFNNIVQVMRGLKEQYNFMGRLGETEPSIESSPVFYAVMAGADWNTKIDYKAVIKDVCDKFYGKAAGTMFKYNVLMDNAVMTSDAWKTKDWIPMNQLEFSMAVLEQGKKLLDKADAEARGNPVLVKRIAQARFSHAYLTYVRALNESKMTSETYRQGHEAYIRANDLRRIHEIRVIYPTFLELKSFKIPPVAGDGSIIKELPIEWKFKIDPNDGGQKHAWFKAEPDTSWRSINTNQAWTEQGVDYHGVAWYSTVLQIPVEAAKNKLDLYFGAVDGYCDIYLDGAKIGEQKGRPEEMWNQPFRISLPASADLTRMHRLTVRVRKDNFAAGIWKPVSIVKAVGH